MFPNFPILFRPLTIALLPLSANAIPLMFVRNFKRSSRRGCLSSRLCWRAVSQAQKSQANKSTNKYTCWDMFGEKKLLIKISNQRGRPTDSLSRKRRSPLNTKIVLGVGYTRPSAAWACPEQAQWTSLGLHWASPGRSRWRHTACLPSAL